MDDNLEWDLRGYFAKGDVENLKENGQKFGEEEEENRGRSFRLGISREKNENRKRRAFDSNRQTEQHPRWIRQPRGES